MPVNCANLPNSLCNILAFFTVSSSDLSGQKTAHLHARHQALTLGIDSLVWVSFNIITTRRTSPHPRANQPVLTSDLYVVYANSLLAVYVFFARSFARLRLHALTPCQIVSTPENFVEWSFSSAKTSQLL